MIRAIQIGRAGRPRWAVTLFDRVDQCSPYESLAGLATARGDAFVVTTRTMFCIDPNGDVKWTEAPPGNIDDGVGLPIAHPDGSLIWAFADDDGIHLRFLDDAGNTRFEERIPSDGNGLSDIAILGDELFVVTIDRLTRVRLHALPPASTRAQNSRRRALIVSGSCKGMAWPPGINVKSVAIAVARRGPARGGQTMSSSAETTRLRMDASVASWGRGSKRLRA